LTTQSLLYFWCVCLMRLHIAAFLPHLHNDSECPPLQESNQIKCKNKV
jgi:hypothetical protein